MGDLVLLISFCVLALALCWVLYGFAAGFSLPNRRSTGFRLPGGRSTRIVGAVVLMGCAVFAVVATGSDPKAVTPISHFPIVSSPRLEKIAASTGVRVKVRCVQTHAKWVEVAQEGMLGVYSDYYREIELAPRICSGLADSESAQRCRECVLVLLHEFMHAEGIPVESKAECQALQRLHNFAITYFGYSEDQARAAVREMYHANRERPPEYLVHDCTLTF